MADWNHCDKCGRVKKGCGYCGICRENYGEHELNLCTETECEAEVRKAEAAMARELLDAAGIDYWFMKDGELVIVELEMENV